MGNETPKHTPDQPKPIPEIRAELMKVVEAAREDSDVDSKEKEAIRERLTSLFQEMGVPDNDIQNLLPQALEAAAKNKEEGEKDALETVLTELEAKYPAKTSKSAEKPQAAETPLIIRAFGKLPSEIQTTPAEGLKIDAFLTKLSQEPVILAAYKDASVRTGKMGEIKARLQKAGDGEPLKTEMLAVLDNLATDNKVVVEKLKPYESTNKAEQLGSGFVSMLEKAGASSSMIASIIKMFVDGLQNSFPGLDLSFLDNMRWPHVAKDYRDNMIPKVLTENGDSWQMTDDEIIKLAKSWDGIPDEIEVTNGSTKTTEKNKNKPKEFAAYLTGIRDFYRKSHQEIGTSPITWDYAKLAEAQAGYHKENNLESGGGSPKQQQLLDQYIDNTSLAKLTQRSHEFNTSSVKAILDFVNRFAEKDREMLKSVDSGAKDFPLEIQKIMLSKKLHITDDSITIRATTADTLEIQKPRGEKLTLKTNSAGDSWTIEGEAEPITTDSKLIEKVGEWVKPTAATAPTTPASAPEIAPAAAPPSAPSAPTPEPKVDGGSTDQR